ncbi:MAG: PIN domain-containing protein [Bifidobacteriaceae bacterium]|jgi:predicted nucleic acid-binding protein|nr:PIN domain-containing protein [Bifidobacteriaceae bacterium]
MPVLVDTSVWSLALRRQRVPAADEHLVRALAELMLDARVALIGPIRQELLSGIRDLAVFERLMERLDIYHDEPVTSADYVTAARYANECRRHGIRGSGVDFLICAVATSRDWPIFTTDDDFAAYAKHLPIKLFQPGGVA